MTERSSNEEFGNLHQEEPQQQEEDPLRNSSLYSLLGIDEKATTKDINSAYLNLIKLYHPDRIKTPEEFDQNKFQRIVEAHSILKNEQFRKFYDSFGYDACKKLLSNKLVQTGPAAETRTKETVEDLLKSYAKIKADEDSQMLFNLVNPRGKFKFHADCRELFYADQFTGYPINNNCNSLEQTIDFDIGDKNLLSLGGKITDNLGCAKSSIFGSFIHQIRPGFTFESSFDSLRTNANLGLVRDFQRFGILSSNINLFLKEYQTILPTLTLGYSRHLDKLSTSRANISTSVSPGLSYVSAGLLHSDVYKNIHTSSSINLKFGNIIQLSAKSVLKSESSSLKITNVAEYGYLTKKLCIGIEKGFNQCTKILSRVSLNLLSGIRLTVGIKRGKYIYALPMQLSDEIILQPVAVALISLFLASDGIRCFGDYISKCLNRTITDPEDIAKQTNASYDRLKKCDEYQKSNRDEYLECVQQETAAEGLVIQKALFGPIVMEDGQVNGITECYDVTVASQLLVENHQINIKSRTNLSQLEGFFDPTPGESKNILFRYVYATQQHLAIFKDKEEIFIPQESHLL